MFLTIGLDMVDKLIGSTVVAYGPIAGLYLGNKPLIVVNSFDLAKDLLSREEFCGSVHNYTTKWARSTTGENLGIATTDGKRWYQQRTFTVKELKRFGFGTKVQQDIILEEVMKLIAYLKFKTYGNSHEINHKTFSYPIINVLWTIVANQRFERADPNGIELFQDLNDFIGSGICMIATLFPWIRFIFSSLTGYSRSLELLNSIKQKIKQTIREHRRTMRPSHEQPQDFINAYLKEIDREENSDSNLDQLTMVCLELLIAGLETTTCTLMWGLMYLTLFPDVQMQCHKEVIETFGTNNIVSLNDMTKMPYIRATISEIQRHSAVSSTDLPHRVTKVVKVNGYHIPKNCLLLTNLKHIMQNPQNWKDPESFKPERFLDANFEFVNRKELVPFEIGRRICMGNSIA